MFCPKCGQEMLEDSIVCSACGTQLDASLLEGEDINDLIDLIEEADAIHREKRDARQPVSRPAAKKKNKKTGVIITIIVLILIFLGFIVAGLSFVKKQREIQKAVEDFSFEVDVFEDYLADVEYDSVRNDMAKLFEECKDALEAKDVESFDDLRNRIETEKLEALALSEQIATLDELKATYEELFARKYFISEELKTQMTELFESMQADIDAGVADQMDTYKEALAQLENDLKEYNLGEVEAAKEAVAQLDLTDMTEGEENTLNLYLEDAEKCIADEDYKGAVNKATTYVNYANQVVNAIAQRREESIAESIAESKRRAEEESRRQESKRQEEANKKPTSGSYVCPGSNSRYLTEADVAGLDAWSLMIARNEIYARHGRKFNDPNLQAYFNKQSWYKGTIAPENFDPSVFNKYEEANIDFIRAYE